MYVAAELTVSGGTLSRNDAGIDTGGGLYNVAKATISNATIANNTTWGLRGGGGIFNGGNGFEHVGAELTLTGSVVSGNLSRSGLGGGISNAPGSTATVIDSRVVGNWAREDGGGLFNGGLLHLTRSEVSDNGESPDDEEFGDTRRGGGLANTLRLTPSGSASQMARSSSSSNL